MPENQPPSAVGNRPIRVALIGAGYVSPYHLEGWQRHQNLEIVALCDLDQALTEARARQFDILTATIQHFVECLRSGTPFETGPEDNLKTLALTFAAYESLKTGQAIPLPCKVEKT